MGHSTDETVTPGRLQAHPTCPTSLAVTPLSLSDKRVGWDHSQGPVDPCKSPGKQLENRGGFELLDVTEGKQTKVMRNESE